MLETTHHNDKRCFWQMLWSLISFPYNIVNTLCKYSTVVYFFCSFFHLICLDRWVVCIDILLFYHSLLEGGFQGMIHRPMLTLVFNHWTICKTNGKARWEQIKFSLPQLYKYHANYHCKHRHIEQVGVNHNILQDVKPKSH